MYSPGVSTMPSGKLEFHSAGNEHPRDIDRNGGGIPEFEKLVIPLPRAVGIVMHLRERQIASGGALGAGENEGRFIHGGPLGAIERARPQSGRPGDDDGLRREEDGGVEFKVKTHVPAACERIVHLYGDGICPGIQSILTGQQSLREPGVPVIRHVHAIIPRSGKGDGTGLHGGTHDFAAIDIHHRAIVPVSDGW